MVKSLAVETVVRWNDKNPVGTIVQYWRGTKTPDAPPSGVGKTTQPASLLGGHTPVVWIEGCSGCIALTHVEVVR